MATLNNDLLMYRTAQSQKLKLSQWYQIPVWGDLIGFVGGTDNNRYPKSIPFGGAKANRLRGTGKPVEVLADWFHQGGWDIEIPTLLPLREKPVVADDQAFGKEEDRAWVYQKAYITQVRRPAKVTDGAMGDLAINPNYYKQLINSLRDDFVDYNKRLQAYSPYDAIYRGYDDQLLRSRVLGLSQKSHPNIFVEGYGRVTYDPDNDTYETNVKNVLQNLGANNKFTMKTLRRMQAIGSELMFVETTAGTYAVKGVAIINDRQMMDLVEDPLFQKMQVQLITKEGTDSPLYHGRYETYLVEGVMILVDQNNPGVWIAGDSGYDSSRGILNYGNVEPLKNPVHQSDIKGAIYMSASAILCGTTKALRFENETGDYGNVKGETSITVVGYNRADYIDADNLAPNYPKNTSSLVVFTYAKQDLNWSASS